KKKTANPSSKDEKTFATGMRKAMSNLFGDWFFQHNWNADAQQVKRLAKHHGTLEEEKKPMIDAAASTKVETNSNENLDKDKIETNSSKKEEFSNTYPTIAKLPTAEIPRPFKPLQPEKKDIPPKPLPVPQPKRGL